MRRSCKPGRGAFMNAALPARQMNGLKQEQRHNAADQQELADRIGRHQPFADRAGRPEQEDRNQHEADAGKNGRTAR